MGEIISVGFGTERVLVNASKRLPRGPGGQHMSLSSKTKAKRLRSWVQRLL